jgi:hypothetical protein
MPKTVILVHGTFAGPKEGVTQLLTAKIRESQIWKRIGPAAQLISQHRGTPLDDELWLQRLSVAIEERVREVSGLVPLNHSNYYSNQKTIEKLSEIISSKRV